MGLAAAIITPPASTTPLVLNCDGSAEISPNSYDVSFAKLYDVTSAPNNNWVHGGDRGGGGLKKSSISPLAPREQDTRETDTSLRRLGTVEAVEGVGRRCTALLNAKFTPNLVGPCD